MVTNTKTSVNTSTNFVDLAFNGSKSVSSKSSTDLYKTDSNTYTSGNEDFKTVLSSKTTSRGTEDNKKLNDNTSNVSTKVNNTDDAEDTKNTEDTKDTDKINEKLEGLEEESKSDSKDKVNDVLNELLNMLAKLGIKEEDLKSNAGINSDSLKAILEGINAGQSSNGNLSEVMQKIMELLKNDSVKEGLDSNSVKTIEKILGNLSSSLSDDNTSGVKNLKNSLKNLMSEVSNVLHSKQSDSNKVLTLEELLNKNNSGDSSENSNDSNNTASSNDSKGVSKEDKFLNSLVDDKDDSMNKINLYAARNTVIQNQGVNTVRGLTINKATFVDDLIKDVKFMNSNSLKELTVKVNPGNLGEITIKLIQEDGIMKANLKANSKETTALLSQNLAEIKKQLGEQNIKISDVNIELYQDDTTFFNEQSFSGQLSEEQGRNGNKTSGSISGLSVDEEDLTDINATNDNNIEFFA